MIATTTTTTTTTLTTTNTATTTTLMQCLKNCKPFYMFRMSPDSVAELFEALAAYKNGVIEVRVSGQLQQSMGFRSGT